MWLSSLQVQQNQIQNVLALESSAPLSESAENQDRCLASHANRLVKISLESGHT